MLLAAGVRTPAKSAKKLKRARPVAEVQSAKKLTTEDKLVEEIKAKGGFKALPLNAEIFKPVENVIVNKPDTTKP